MIYTIYIFVILIAIGISVFLYRRKQKITLILTIFPTSLSLLSLLLYAQMNFFIEPCGWSSECMNETGLWLFFAMYLIAISVGILVLSLIINWLRHRF